MKFTEKLPIVLERLKHCYFRRNIVAFLKLNDGTMQQISLLDTPISELNKYDVYDLRENELLERTELFVEKEAK